ncbi:MAG: hypothetical protein M1833_004246 [Piccolia ochrophora]|nr:MAG: hypothetical protein M1833_004246 [Piccolia ochrophora]
MDDDDGTYAPESPDASAFEQPSYSLNTSAFPPHAPPYESSFLPQHYQPANSYHQPQFAKHGFGQPVASPVGYGGGASFDDEEWVPSGATNTRSRGKQGKAPITRTLPSDVEVKTKFPVARIKRIMQADEDVGKVAQVTPVVVSKALELFMISLVTKAADEAKSKTSKRVTAAHLKQAISKDEQFDFLQDIIAKIPDAPVASEKAENGDDGSEGKRKRVGTKKRRKDSEEF